jgi:hypothetical protein
MFYLMVVASKKKVKKQVKPCKPCEDDFSMLFNHVTDGIAVYDFVDGHFVFADINKAVERIDNVKRRNVVGKRVDAVFPGVKDFGLLDIFKVVHKDGRPRVLPLRMYADERIQGWRKNYVFKNSKNQIVAIYSDLTSLKYSEKELADRVLFQDLLVRYARRFAESRSPKGALKCGLADLGKASGADRVTVLRVNHKERVVMNVFEWAAKGVYLRASVKELRRVPLSEYRFLLRKIGKSPFLFVPDVSASRKFSRHERLALLQQRISAYFVVPLRKSGSVEGLLILENFNVGLAWEKGVADIVSAFGNVVCLGLHCFV